MFTIKIDMEDVNTILKSHGLEANGKVQKFFTNEIMRASDDYTPNDGGILRASARNLGNAILYNTPYARYHWYGKLMVDPITGKGSFFKEGYGHWSRPNTPKVLTQRDMKYKGSPTRGPRWVERAWVNNKDSIIESTEKFIRGVK